MPVSVTTPPHYRILVIDDNENCAKVMMWTIETFGHTCKMAHDGVSAIALAESFLPDIVFSDIGLPGMNGYDICKAMRNIPALKNTIFVAQTGWGQREHMDRSKAAGFDYHLVKPVSIDALKNILLTMDERSMAPLSLDLAS